MLLRVVGLISPILSLSRLINVQRRESNFSNSSKNFHVSLYWDIYRQISFRLGVMIDISKLYTSVNDLNNNNNNNNNNNSNNNNNNRIQRHYSRFFTISSQRRELPPTHMLK